jgi:hypothetical protein
MRTKKIVVDIKDIGRLCECCGIVGNSVRRRTYRTKNFEGSCGDSFCYASCDLSSCKPITVNACEGCEAAGQGKP